MFYKFLLVLVFGVQYISISQTKYNKLGFELIDQFEQQHFTKKIPTDSILIAINELPDSSKKQFLLNKTRKLFAEVAFGHEPKYLEFNALTQRELVSPIEKAISDLENGISLAKIVEGLEPKNRIFERIKNHPFIDSIPQLTENLNFYRYLNRFSLDKYIVINIPSAWLTVFEKDEVLLEMPIIVGTKANQTPPMASYIESIVTYPYWVPTRSIVTKELLPQIKKDINYLAMNNFEVLDKNGKIIDPKNINWSAFSEKNFPYKIRQSTGCDNSLGLLKFNLVNPFSIYLHDTKHQKYSQSLFAKKDRYFSHGCMRLSKPRELANLLMEKEMFDDDFMETCLKDQTTNTISLPNKIPVFILYQTMKIDQTNKIINYKDPYQKLAKR